MRFQELKLSGVYLIEAEPHVDQRGLLRRHFCQEEFKAHGLESNIEQCNISENKNQYTLRGFHWQTGNHAEAKTISCMRGSLHDIVVDLRPESKTYEQWVSVELSSKNQKSLHLPPGCANAFLTLETDTWIHYYHSKSYAPGNEKGMCFNDAFFKFDWPAGPVVISDRDMSYPDFKVSCES